MWSKSSTLSPIQWFAMFIPSNLFYKCCTIMYNKYYEPLCLLACLYRTKWQIPIQTHFVVPTYVWTGKIGIISYTTLTHRKILLKFSFTFCVLYTYVYVMYLTGEKFNSSYEDNSVYIILNQPFYKKKLLEFVYEYRQHLLCKDDLLYTHTCSSWCTHIHVSHCYNTSNQPGARSYSSLS